MNFAKNRATKTIIAMILVLSMTIPLTTLPANAQQTKTTWPYVGAMINPIGVGQTELIAVGIPDSLAKTTDSWNMTLTITKPNGENETIPVRTDSSGMTGIPYVPDKVGTYYFQAYFPAQWYNRTGNNIYYQAAISPQISVVVQEEAIPYYPDAALPTDYWTRPINSQLRDWYTISGNWLAPTVTLPTTNLDALDNEGPESGHILWTMPIGDTMGGLAGGVDETGYGIGDAYEGKWSGTIIISGVLFYNKYDSLQPTQKVVAVDLHTGEVLWERSLANNNGVLYGNGRISFGQVLRYKSINYQGDFSYLWIVSGTNWYAFDPMTGDWAYNMTNVPSGTNYYGPKGEILRYTVDSAHGWMTQWNSTSVVHKGPTTGLAWGSQVSGKQFNATLSGYDWNVSIPQGLPGSIRTVNPLDRLIGASITATDVTIWALSLETGQEGQLLYKTTWNAPSDWASGNQSISWAAASLTDNAAVLFSKERTNYYGFSLETGQYLWGPTPSEPFLNMYDHISTINYGKLISSGTAGVVNCYDVTTGDLLWNYNVTQPYTEFQIGAYWWMQQMFITDGKVYLGQVEHSPNQPLPRGAPFLCLNVTTGDVVWQMTGGFRQTVWGGKAIIADSIISLMDTYDQRMYAIGKGPTSTTVTASPSVSVHGSSVMIQGTVNDVSPGTKSDDTTLRFPNGVPAVSDDSMSEWMQYVYMQFAQPTNATGVPVTLAVLDTNGNYREIGSTTSDANGFYSFSWEPDIDGKYTVYASFLGTKSYYGSSAETSFAVDPAPPTTGAPTATPASVADMYFVPAIAGLFVLIIIVLALVMLILLKKRQ